MINIIDVIFRPLGLILIIASNIIHFEKNPFNGGTPQKAKTAIKQATNVNGSFDAIPSKLFKFVVFVQYSTEPAVRKSTG
jgi:hypothetical protein